MKKLTVAGILVASLIGSAPAHAFTWNDVKQAVGGFFAAAGPNIKGIDYTGPLARPRVYVNAREASAARQYAAARTARAKAVEGADLWYFDTYINGSRTRNASAVRMSPRDNPFKGNPRPCGSGCQ